MVRFLQSTIYEFETHDELERFLVVERLLALFHIPASVCLAMGSLAEVGIVPYASKWEPYLLLFASLFLVVSNSREANQCIRSVFLPKRRHAILNNSKKTEPTVGDQMHMFAAVMMALGSLSLFNSSLISFTDPLGSESVLSRRQYAVAFCFFLVGSAGNNLSTEHTLRVTQFTRVMLSFQNVMCSASFGVSGLLMLPSFRNVKDGMFSQNALLGSTALGSFFAVLSAMMHYFHTVALAWAHIEVFESKSYAKSQQKSTVVSQENSESNQGYLRRLRDALTSGHYLIWRQRNQQTTNDKKRGEMQPRDAVDNESDIYGEVTGPDEYDGSSFSPVDSTSEPSSWSESEQVITSPSRIEGAT